MSPVARIARTEILEQRRQPWMIGILAANYVILIAMAGAGAIALGIAASDPAAAALVRSEVKALGFDYENLPNTLVTAFTSLMFTNLSLFVAYMSGTSVLHDRECGALPFLMLAPLTRRQLLVGKLAGAMAIPFALHVAFATVGALALGRLPALAHHADMLAGCPAWWVAMLAGAPGSAAFIGALGTVVSARSSDNRTSQQYMAFIMSLLSVSIGYMLADGISLGAGIQLAFALGCVVAAGLTLLVGAWLISQDYASF